MSNKKNKLYNYLINTYGLSKDHVLKLFDERIENLLKKHIMSKLDSNHVESMMLNIISKSIKEGFKGNYRWNNKLQFEKYIKECVKDVISEKMNKEYSMEVSLNIKKEDKK